MMALQSFAIGLRNFQVALQTFTIEPENFQVVLQTLEIGLGSLQGGL